MKFSIDRFCTEQDSKPYMQDFETPLDVADRTLMHLIRRIKAKDDTVGVRKACRAGVCGSDAIDSIRSAMVREAL